MTSDSPKPTDLTLVRDRLCPVPFGALVHRGGILTSINPQRRLDVSAPTRLIKRVIELCDGTRTLDELHSETSDHPDLRDFVEFLLDQEVLVDASLLTCKALAYGKQASPYGRSAPTFLTNRSGPRVGVSTLPANTEEIKENRVVAPDSFWNLVRDRITHYTFDPDARVGCDVVRTLLWAISGIVEDVHPRLGSRARLRTHASAGALYLTRIYLILVRNAGEYGPGVYRVVYPHAMTVQLQRVSEQHEYLYRAYTRPDYLHGATGAIVITGDIPTAALRYRNRATQYLFTEAGAMLQNGALCATQLDIAFTTLGNYHEDILVKMCSLEDSWNILGTALFGKSNEPAPVLHQSRLLFSWVDGESDVYSLPHFLGRTQRIEQENTDPTHSAAADYAWGYDQHPLTAFRKACAEFVEREALTYVRDVFLASAKELPNHVPPGCLVRYSAAQHRQKDFPYKCLRGDEPALWMQGVNCRDGTVADLPAQLIYPHAALAAFWPTHEYKTQTRYTQATTSGCAAGVDTEQALEHALLELVERDAFMRHWFEQSPGIPVPSNTLASDVSRRLRAMTDAGCRVGVQYLPSPWAPVALVWAQHEAMAFTTLGTAARRTGGLAILAALAELETRVFVWINGHRPQATQTITAVNSARAHFEIYGSRRHFRKADALLLPFVAIESEGSIDAKVNFKTNGAQNIDAHAASKGEHLTMVDRFLAEGRSPYYVDITPARNAIESGRVPLKVVKAFVPGLIPMSFGHGLEPRGMVARVHRHAHFPHPFP